ncbi:peptide/nickel transport system ATP-binding protein [Sporobacter termitidis DSM 10068]|uniref:Peptide/nickel transport system ATP-binding protein n=1 Tax=Sporobacter termitidis DSM 10068 TaxID=1123282 RepID=A0A1M5XWD1_9FIRM|nr:ABC transporter ATP-binding protein [Sporobacter termitidis]SHI04145.1 peptide/nickel transport system ATP-binding protein [Sporobacter termitidis DSM 10068]
MENQTAPVSAQDEFVKTREWQELMESDALLKVTDLQVHFQTERALIKALNGVDLLIRKGESLGLVGETGAGKTTTALSILNLLRRDIADTKDGSSIVFDGKSVFDMSEKELRTLRGGKVSMVFQNPLTALNPVFTVGEQIGMVLRVHQKMNDKDALKRAGELLEMVGIAGSRIKDYPSQFSGGMRQRVGIAAALACNPQLLIADEPTTALDVTIQAQILELMRGLQTKYDTSLLMITHNLGIISELCQQLAVMYAGRIIEYGSAKDVLASPRHPYTQGLLGALPSLEGPRHRLTAIPGVIADASNLPDGCAFHPRCAQCCEECKTRQPSMMHVGNGHFVACFNHGKE